MCTWFSWRGVQVPATKPIVSSPCSLGSSGRAARLLAYPPPPTHPHPHTHTKSSESTGLDAHLLLSPFASLPASWRTNGRPGMPALARVFPGSSPLGTMYSRP